jgi:hypothetical protein
MADTPTPPEPAGGYFASNPVHIRANYLKHALCYPVGAFFTITLIGGGVALAVMHHWAWWSLAGVGTLVQFGLWRTNRNDLMHGDLVPGVVIKDKPWTVAVYADLSRDLFRQRPALQILRLPLGRMRGGPPKVGDYIPMVAMYGAKQDDGTWGYFWPDAVGCNTFDAAAVGDAARRISPKDAAALEEQLSQLEEWNEGTYKMWMPVAEFEEIGVPWLDLLKLIGLAILIVGLVGVWLYAKVLRHFIH